jgi:hypothetical protein
MRLTTNCSYVVKTIIYLLLVNLPHILLFGISLINENSQIGFKISCDVDLIQVLVVSSYICYVEESRQTPIRGLIFTRDLIVTICCLICLSVFKQDGQYKSEYGFVVLGIYLLFLILQLFEVKMEESVLQILGIKESYDYNSNFLLTQSRRETNYLKIQCTVQENKALIQN